MTAPVRPPTPRVVRLGWAGVVAVTLLTGSGCAGPAAPSALSPTPSATRSVTPPDPATSTQAWIVGCVTQVTYWVTKVREEPDHSYDYQEMGLSSSTYEALRAVLELAGDTPRDSAWVQAEATTSCARHVPTPRPSDAQGWP